MEKTKYSCTWCDKLTPLMKVTDAGMLCPFCADLYEVEHGPVDKVGIKSSGSPADGAHGLPDGAKRREP